MVEIRLIGTATATFNEAAYEKAEGDSFEVTVTLPVTVKAWSRRVL